MISDMGRQEATPIGLGESKYYQPSALSATSPLQENELLSEFRRRKNYNRLCSQNAILTIG